MKAVVDGTVVAEAPQEDLIKIEGNWYFPPSSVRSELFEPSPTPYTCPWKGACQYFTLTVDGKRVEDGAWAYPNLYDGAVKRVGQDFANYVAFSPGVRVTE